MVRVFQITLLSLFFTFKVLAAPSQIAVLSGTETTAVILPNDLNQATPYAIKWSNSSFDTSYFDHSVSSFSHQVQVKVGGDYRLSFTLPLTLTDTSSNRRAILGEVYVNGSPISTGRMASSYIRQGSDHNESSLHAAILLEGLNVNDTISVYVNQDTTETGEVTTSGAQLFLEFIDPARTVFLATGTETTNSTNFNQSTEFAVEWDELEKDSGFSHSDSTNPQNITLDTAGSYLVFVNIPFESTTCTTRSNVEMRIKLDGVTVSGGTAAQGYIRCFEDHEKSSVHWAGLVTSTSANQVLTITTQAETTSTQSMIVPTGREASLFVEKVDTSSEYISLSGTTVLAGSNWNASPGSEIQWTTQNVYDAGTYTHSTSSNSHKVAVATSGSYFLIYNDHLTSTAARSNPRAKIIVNNSALSTGVCKTHYIRNTGGHNESSCSLTHYVADLQAGDEVSIEMEQEAAGGTVNDASPGLLTLVRVADAEPPTCTDVVDCTPDLVLHVDGNELSSVLDEISREASDISFSGTTATWKDVSESTTNHDIFQNTASSRPSFDVTTNRMIFDGVDDHFDVTNHPDLNTGTLKERTIVVAFTTGSDVTNQQVIYEEGGTVRGMNVYIRGGDLYIGFWNLANDGDGSQPFTSASTSVQPNTNYFASLVIDYSNYTGGAGPDGELRGHINGVSFATLGTTTSLLYSHPGAIAVGAKMNDTYYDTGASSGSGDYFGGDIYELLIYNHAIDDTEAVEFYNYMVDRWPDPHPMTDVVLASQYTNSSSVTPNISWTASVSPDINRYELALGTSAGDDSVSTWTSVGTATSGNITGLALAECVDYFASVRAIDDDSNVSPEVSTDFIRFDGTAPSDPSDLVISGTSSTSTSKTLSWTASSDACSFSNYEASIGTTPGASDIVSWTDIGGVTSHQFTGLSLSDATDYYTSIRAFDTASNVTSVVTSASWQVDTCVASDVTSPTDPGSFVTSGSAGTTSSPSHTWTASTDGCGFSHYELSIGTSAAAIDVQGWTNVGDILTHKFFSLAAGLSTNTNYFTNIKAVDLAGNESSVVSTSAWQLPAPGDVSSGLVLWLDSSESSNVFTDAGCSSPATDGSSVQCWKDLSSEANNATATGTARPTWQDTEFNEQAVIRFDGSNDALDFTAISDIRTVFVVNKSDTSSFQQFLGHTSSRDFYTPSSVLIGSTISNSDLVTGNWRVDQVDVSSPTTFVQTGSYSMISVVSDGSVAADHIASDQKTGGRFFDGDIAEVIIYDRALTSGEITDVESYLYSKWFTANPAAVTDLTFDNDYTATSVESPVFSWTHSTAPDLSYYEVALGLSAGSNDIAGWTNIGLSNSHQYSGLSLPECTDFYGSVRAFDTDGFVSSTESTSFGRFDGTAPTDPSSLILSGTAAPTTSRTLSWSAAADACSLSHYEVALGTTAGGSDIITWTNVGDVASHQFTGISPALAFATDYYLSVRAVDSAGNASNDVSSASWQLDTCVASDVTAPTTVSGLSTSGQGTVTKGPGVSWSPSSDGCAFSHYEIGIGTSSGAVDVVGFTNIGDTTSYQITELSPNLSFGTNYYYTLKAVDEAGNDSAATSTALWTVYQPGGTSVAVTGLEVWLDANDGNTLYQNSACTTTAGSENDNVACIKDKSGNDSHATNSTPSSQPTLKLTSFNSLPSLYFDGSADQFLDFGSHSNIRTVFWVLREDVSNPGSTAFLLGDPGGSTFDFHRDSTLGPIFSSANASSRVTGGTLQMNSSSIDGTTTGMPNAEAVLSLVTTGNTTASAFSRDRTSCCGSRTWGGSLAELIVFNRALSAGEVSDVESYLMTKWAVSAGTTNWTGAVSTDWFNAGNWDNGVPTSSQNCVIDGQTNDPSISGGTAVCADVDIGDGIVTFANGTGATLQVFGDFQNTGTINQNDGVIEFVDDGNIATTQEFQSTTAIESLRFDKSAGGSVIIAGTTLTVNDFVMTSGNSFSFVVPINQTLTLPNGLSMASGTFDVQGGGTIEIGSSQNITVTGGTFQTSGTNDAHPQTTSNKATITRQSTGRWGFDASAGAVSLTGFIIDYIDSSGLNLTGTVDLADLDGGQFTNLNQDYATPVTAIQLNSTTTPSETLASNVGFNWLAANANHVGIPDPADNYYLVSAPNCNGSAIVFDLWFGDFFAAINDPVTEDKILDADDGANNCQISMSVSASPVTLTSFDIYGYDQSALLLWETGAEINHLGFNILRSDSMHTGYTQVNPSIILNFNNSTVFRGDYYFLDENLTNDQTYYYMIEDVALDGTIERHGPIAVMPQGSAGTAPAPDVEDNTSIDPPVTGGDLGDGAEIISQTNNSIRLQITPDALDVQDAAWDVNYKDLYITGYSKTLESGHPELLERKILIEVESNYTSLNVAEVLKTSSQVSASLSGEKVSPAPTWTLNASNVLEASYAEDATAYANSSYSPSVFYSIKSEATVINGKYYIEVTVWPLNYKADSNDLLRLDNLIVDIGIDGNAWQTAPPTDSYTISPASVDGNIRIKYDAAGMYEVTYDDLAAANIEGTLSGVDVDDLRMFYHGEEIPIEVIDSDSSFNSGDAIRFYGSYELNIEDELDEVVLTAHNHNGSEDEAYRFVETANPAATTPVAAWMERSVTTTAEQNLTAIFDVPIGGIVDRFYWKRIYIQSGNTPDANAQLDFNVDLSNIITSSDQPVSVKVHLRALGVYAKNPTFSLGIYLDGDSSPADVKTFTGSDPQVIEFTFDSSKFVDGMNSLRLESQGDQIPTGDFEMHDINKIEFTYSALIRAKNSQIHLSDLAQQQQVIVDGFNSVNLNIYDHSNNVDGMKYTSFTTEDLGSSNYMIQFDTYAGLQSQSGTQLSIVEDGAFLAPTSLDYAVGASQGLRDPANQGEYLVIGTSELLDVAYDLTRHRESQGLTVMSVTYDQIEAEFSNGRRSSYGIREFVNMALTNWAKPPKYVLLLGDASYDPNDHLGNGNGRLVPAALERGEHLDFASDNFYVEDGTDHRPQLAVGRIPSNDVIEVTEYIEKLLAYENGDRSPTLDNAKTAFFISGADDKNEGFAAEVDKLADNLLSYEKNFSAVRVHRNDYGSDAAAKAAIDSEFDAGKVMITFLGHGAEDLWGSNDMFNATDVKALDNNELPIVLALNCLNNYYYDPDTSYRSMGEEMIFNPDGGAVAFWGSTSLTSPVAQLNLANSLYAEMAQKTKGVPANVRLGDLILNAKVSQGTDGYTEDAVRSYTLFGDPALLIPQASFSGVAETESTTSFGGGCAASAGEAYSGVTTWTKLIQELAFLFFVLMTWAVLRLRVAKARS